MREKPERDESLYRALLYAFIGAPSPRLTMNMVRRGEQTEKYGDWIR